MLPMNQPVFLTNFDPAELSADSISSKYGKIVKNTCIYIENTKKANQTLGFLKRNIRAHNKDLKSVV